MHNVVNIIVYLTRGTNVVQSPEQQLWIGGERDCEDSRGSGMMMVMIDERE